MQNHRTKSYKISRIAALSVMLVVNAGCGQSIFKSARKIDPASEATVALEKQNPDGAISILNNALAGSPGNPKYLSILATAYAQRAGIDPLHLAISIGTKSSSTAALALASGSSSQFTAMFSLLPEATTQAITDIDLAISILNEQIASADRQPGDLFKTAIYMTASLVFHVKKLDSLGKGTLSTTDLASLSDADADAILNNLSSAITMLSDSGVISGSSDTTTAQASSALSQYSTQINAAPGMTNAEKLRNYLATSSTN